MKLSVTCLALLLLVACTDSQTATENAFSARVKMIEDKRAELGLDESDMGLVEPVDTQWVLDADMEEIFEKMEEFAAEKRVAEAKEKDMLEFERWLQENDSLPDEEKTRYFETNYSHLIVTPIPRDSVDIPSN